MAIGRLRLPLLTSWAALALCAPPPAPAGDKGRLEGPSRPGVPALGPSAMVPGVLHVETLAALSTSIQTLQTGLRAPGPAASPADAARAMSEAVHELAARAERPETLAATGALIRALGEKAALQDLQSALRLSPEGSASEAADGLGEISRWLEQNPNASRAFARDLLPLRRRLESGAFGAPEALAAILDGAFSGSAPGPALSSEPVPAGETGERGLQPLAKSARAPEPRSRAPVAPRALSAREAPDAPSLSGLRAVASKALARVKTAALFLLPDLRGPPPEGVVTPRLGKTVEAEIAYLNEAGPLRVFFADAPGYGHQSATLAVVRRLRALGYTGHIEAVYQDPRRLGALIEGGMPSHFGTVPQKLADLLPEFKVNGPARQTIASLDMTIVPLSSLKADAPRMRLGITGGADVELDFAKKLKTDKFLRLGPMDWRHYDDAIFLPGGATLKIEGNRERAFVYPPAEDAAIDDAYFEGLDPAKYAQAKRRGFAALARGARERDVLPLYGLAFMSAQMLHGVTLGVSQALTSNPELFKGRGVILPLLLDVDRKVSQLQALVNSEKTDEGSESARDRARRSLKRRLRFAAIDDPDLQQVVDGLGADEILLLKTGPVPPAFFEWLFRASTLPPTLEGKNAMNLARMLGVPYIPVENQALGDLREVLDASGEAAGETAHVQGHLTGVVGAMKERRFDAMAAYIVDALTPGSSLRRLFEAARIRQSDYGGDKLLAAINAAMQPGVEPKPPRPVISLGRE